jgi:ribonuclease Z
MMKYGISYGKVRAIFLSHMHSDHFLGLFGLVASLNMAGRAEPLLITGPKGTKEILDQVFSVRALAPLFPIVIKEVGEEEVYKDKFVEVRSFKVKHGTPAVGYVVQQPAVRKFDEKKAKGLGIKGEMFTQIQKEGSVSINGKTIKLEDVSRLETRNKIVYTGDTVPCDEVVNASRGADLLVHDAAFLQEHEEMAIDKKHSTAAGAAQDAKKAGVKKLLLTHISNRYDDRKPLLQEARAIFPATELADEGMELYFK